MASNGDDYFLLEEAIQLFSRCHLLTGSAEAGINTATLLLIGGRQEEARRKAEDTARRCRKIILEKDDFMPEYFAAITAEVHLINGNIAEAESWYRTASSQNRKLPEQVKENMDLLLDYLVLNSETATRIREALGA